MTSPPDGSSPRTNQVTVSIRQVRWSLPTASCDRCSHPARRLWEATRTAIDVDLEQPVLLQVVVSVHFCPACQHHFRAQPPWLRPDATYTKRVVAKAVASGCRDHLPFGRVAQRLARDFWVQPSERMIRLWCRQYTDGLTLEGDYQHWVVEEFSGVLCVDEVYQDKLALLLAVDPRTPQGDRLVGYQLVHGDVQQSDVEKFLQRLRQAGIQPDEVVTDASPLYPSVLRLVWPKAVHQLCLFHETRLVVAAVQQVVQEVQAGLPKPPTIQRPKGRFRKEPPPVAEGTVQPQYNRQSRVALVLELHRQGYSQRAIARRTGHSRVTIDRWLRECAAARPTQAQPGAGIEEAVTTIGLAHEDEVAAVRAVASAAVLPEEALTSEQDRPLRDTDGAKAPDWRERPTEPPPPEPWQSWDQVRAYRHDLQASRFLLLRRPDHLTEEEQIKVQSLLDGPAGEPLRVARAFLIGWYQVPRDEHGLRRTPEEALARWQTWQQNPESRRLAPLRRLLDRMDETKASQVLAFLQRASWEATNNGAEREARQFRHLQAACFRLRTEATIEGAVKADALQAREASAVLPLQTGRSSRGRHPAPMKAHEEVVAA